MIDLTKSDDTDSDSSLLDLDQQHERQAICLLEIQKSVEHGIGYNISIT